MLIIDITMLKLKIVILFIFILLASVIYAQPPLPAPTGRLVLRQGGNIVFNFNSLKRYKDGITYNRWTTFDIKYDSDGGGTSWKLSLKANAANFDGDMGATLDLDKLEITALDGGGINDLTAFCLPTITLTNLDQDLVAGGPPDGLAAGDNLIDLTYECGVTNKVIGEISDYYVVDLEITLYED